MSNWAYIIAAYALTWLALAGYAVYLRVRSRRARRSLEELEQHPRRESERS